MVLLAALGFGLSVWSCASEDSRTAGGNGGANTGGSTSESPGGLVLDIGGGDLGGSGGLNLHPLCGQMGPCMPDDPMECTYPSGDDGDGEEVGIGGMGGAGVGFGGMAGASTGGAGGYPGDDLLGCQLIKKAGETRRSCEVAGTGELDAPCLSSAHCAPGFACVGEGASGLCRPYCCRGDQASCSAGTYCVARRVIGASDELMAPVCARADQCKLTEEYPCPEGTQCQCGEGTACVAVRSDGTTSCVAPGTAKKGEACDGPFSCSWGHVCSFSRGCLKLCSTVSTRDQCEPGEFCQALAGFTDDVGVCLSLSE